MKPSEIIKAKLEKAGGQAYCPMLKGEPLKIWLAPNDKGVLNSGYQDFVCEWHIFDAIVEKAQSLGGKMYKGDWASQSGKIIGSAELPLDTIDAFISVEFYSASVGGTTTRRSTYYAAILAWAGICTNNKSEGNGRGGFIKLS